MKSDLLKKYEKLFLEAKAKEWGLCGDDALIFIYRTIDISPFSTLSNTDLSRKLEFVNLTVPSISK